MKVAIAIVWFLFTSVLLCIPGNKLPHSGWWTHIPLFDKWVHLGLFVGLSYWCSNALPVRYCKTNWWAIMAVLSSGYGVVMEFVQRNYIPNRSFDAWDIVADTAGSFIAFFILLKWKKK